ncbi:MAG: methyltransferase domain-containing protein [Myxococcales bacterium]
MSSFADLADALAERAHVGVGLLRALAISAAVRLVEGAVPGPPLPPGPLPEAERDLTRRLVELFEDDWRLARAGLIPASSLGLPWLQYAALLPSFLADLPAVHARMRSGRTRELAAQARPERYPRYFARNFHWQSEGWLGHRSARLYDLQVELVFGGAADAMRRRMVPPVVELARALPDAPLQVLDVACGTGRLLRMLGEAIPGARLTGVDLSPYYVSYARAALPRALDVSLVCENAEALPFPDGRFDATTCLYLFHELPPKVRTRVMAELARVTRPGGRVVVGDSLQAMDAPALRAVLEAFPVRYHEPFYAGYLREDLGTRAEEAGLRVRSVRHAFLTKVVVAEKTLPSP